MIFIIRALSQWGKDDGGYDSPTSRDETPDEKKEKRPKEKKEGPNKKMREKERRDNVTILFPHLCFKVAPCSSYWESPMISLSYTGGNFLL